MEVVDDPLIKTSVAILENTLDCMENNKNSATLGETDICQKSNGDAEVEDVEHSEIIVSEEGISENNISENVGSGSDKHDQDSLQNNSIVEPPSIPQETTIQDVIIKTDTTVLDVNNKANEDIITDNSIRESTNEKDTQIEINPETEMSIPSENIENSASEKVTFETEILVESNDNDTSDTEIKIEPNSSTNLLSELGHSIELSDILRVSDVADSNIENNNCSVGPQEMFNKEELLDILEGNDANDESSNTMVTNESTDTTTITHPANAKILEAQIAIDQLHRLKSTRKNKKRRNSKKLSKEELIVEKLMEAEEITLPENVKLDDDEISSAEHVMVGEEVTITEDITVTEEIVINEATKDDSIVSDLVKDWEDEEHLEDGITDKSAKDNVKEDKPIDDSDIVQEVIKVECNSQESTPKDQTGLDKSGDEGTRQRRLGRVIKKKVIFDPDNPDTFTKTKVMKSKDIQEEKEQPPLKKTKVEQISPVQHRSKSKSPISKLQWKKPTPKNSNKYKRPSEIDKLLMDEGALNMIYQLTPEAPKGKKNMKTKAEFIKKIQSSTPVSKEMKFRERKKEYKYEEGEAKKILGSKQRISLSSSVKSPSVSEDFEAHSADDSIIYRRHSSSSYSSSCMSPRRLSDVEGAVGPINSRQNLPENISENEYLNNTELGNDSSVVNSFMGDNAPVASTDIINKDDCLSIKKKLNSKLALALNKRKRDSGKIEKPVKQKRVVKCEIKSPKEDVAEEVNEYKHLSVNTNDRLGEIFIRKSGSKYNLQVISELIEALQFLEAREDTSVTLLTSECGTLCFGLELSLLLDANNEVKTKFAQDIAESVRSLLCSIEQHSKLLCTGVEGSCCGVGLALVALSDVCVASERAVFQLCRGQTGTANNTTPLEPGLAVFTAHYRPWSRPMLNDLVMFGRQLSAIEALQYGLVSRNVWPERFLEQVRAISMDMASLPVQNVLLKKKLLKVDNGSQSTFLNCLEKERDLFVQYWLSPEGQQLLSAHLANS